MLTESERQNLAGRVIETVKARLNGSSPAIKNNQLHFSLSNQGGRLLAAYGFEPAALYLVQRWDEFVEMTSLDSKTEKPREELVHIFAHSSLNWLLSHFIAIQRASLALGIRLAEAQTMREFREGREEWFDRAENTHSLAQWAAMDLPINYRQWTKSETKWIDNVLQSFEDRIKEIVELPKPPAHRPKGRTKTMGQKVKERKQFICEIEKAMTDLGPTFNKTEVAKQLGIGGETTRLQIFRKKCVRLEVDYGEIKKRNRRKPN